MGKAEAIQPLYPVDMKKLTGSSNTRSNSFHKLDKKIKKTKDNFDKYIQQQNRIGNELSRRLSDNNDFYSQIQQQEESFQNNIQQQYANLRNSGILSQDNIEKSINGYIQRLKDDARTLQTLKSYINKIPDVKTDGTTSISNQDLNNQMSDIQSAIDSTSIILADMQNKLSTLTTDESEINTQLAALTTDEGEINTQLAALTTGEGDIKDLITKLSDSESDGFKKLKEAQDAASEKASDMTNTLAQLSASQSKVETTTQKLKEAQDAAKKEKQDALDAEAADLSCSANDPNFFTDQLLDLSPGSITTSGLRDTIKNCKTDKPFCAYYLKPNVMGTCQESTDFNAAFGTALKGYPNGTHLNIDLNGVEYPNSLVQNNTDVTKPLYNTAQGGALVRPVTEEQCKQAAFNAGITNVSYRKSNVSSPYFKNTCFYTQTDNKDLKNWPFPVGKLIPQDQTAVTNDTDTVTTYTAKPGGPFYQSPTQCAQNYGNDDYHTSLQNTQMTTVGTPTSKNSKYKCPSIRPYCAKYTPNFQYGRCKHKDPRKARLTQRYIGYPDGNHVTIDLAGKPVEDNNDKFKTTSNDPLYHKDMDSSVGKFLIRPVTMEQCLQTAINNGFNNVGYRDENHSDPYFRNTCFYTKDISDSNIKKWIPGKGIWSKEGAAAYLPTDNRNGAHSTIVLTPDTYQTFEDFFKGIF